ncbi:MAG: hypothetical protein WCL07_02230 [bacterium]
MKKHESKDIIEEVEEVEEVEVVSESVAKRKKAKKKDAIGKWSGVIFLFLILLVGLLLWVGGEMGVDSSSSPVSPINKSTIMQSKVIVE